MTSPTAQQKALISVIHDWADKLNLPRSHDNIHLNVAERWDVVRKMGVLGLATDANYGGLQQDIITTMHGLEAFGKVCDDAGFSFVVASHLVSCGIPIQRFGDQALKQKYLPLLSDGGMIGAHAITEAHSGSDAFAMKTTATRTEQGYLLNGSKTFISNGPFADIIVVYASTQADAGIISGNSALVVEKDTKGLACGKPMKKMGLRTALLCDLYFDNCEIPATQLIGKEGQGFAIFNHVMKWEVLCSFSMTVGEMQRLLEKCVEYARTRSQFGEKIGKFQAVSHKIANMKIAMESSRAMLFNAGKIFQRGENASMELAMAKILTSEAFVQSALDAIQIFGGYGYMEESGIEEYLRNAVGSKIYSGSSEIQRNTIASLLGL
jgi:alkylation response protein AidB-like acyl-CoA dehydrogenase